MQTAILTGPTAASGQSSRVLSPRAATAVAGGALLLLGGTAVTPSTPTSDGIGYLEVFAGHPTRVALGGLAFVLGHLLLVAPLLRLARLRGVAGGAASVVAHGAVLFGALGLVRLFEVAVATSLEPATGKAVLAEFESMPLALAVILTGVAAVNLGLLSLAVALWRRGLLPAWSPLLVVGGIVGVMTGGDGTPVGLIGSALMCAFLVLLTTVRQERVGQPAG